MTTTCYLTYFGLLLLNCHFAKGIVHPNTTTVAKGYMVYLIKAEQATVKYDNWICGGAIVSPEFILTSAACVRDVQFMYAIAGYEKYRPVNSETFMFDECIRKSKKKIVFTCLPKDYNFTYSKFENWAYIDIALAKVESPYDFENLAADSCTWLPRIIEMSFNYKHMEPGTDAMVLGWGSKEIWRAENDTTDYNSEYLNYTPVLIQDKGLCKKFYKNLPQLWETIDKYMICSMGGGNLDDNGKIINKVKPSVDGCETIDNCPQVSANFETNPYHAAYKTHQARKSLTIDFLRKSSEKFSSYGYTFPMIFLTNDMLHQRRSEDKQLLNSKTKATNTNASVTNTANFTLRPNITTSKEKTKLISTSETNTDKTNEQSTVSVTSHYTSDNVRQDGIPPKVVSSIRTKGVPARRHGFCQNDHGGPLVTWVGGREILLGVASVFLLKDNNKCVGPYLYTSTNCNGAFISCVLKTNEPKTTPNPADREPSRRFTVRVPDWFNPAICSLPPHLRGFDIERREISWVGHPDGPADNERDRLNEHVYEGNDPNSQAYEPVNEPIEKYFYEPRDERDEQSKKYSFKPTNKQYVPIISHTYEPLSERNDADEQMNGRSEPLDRYSYDPVIGRSENSNNQAYEPSKVRNVPFDGQVYKAVKEQREPFSGRPYEPISGHIEQSHVDVSETYKERSEQYKQAARQRPPQEVPLILKNKQTSLYSYDEIEPTPMVYERPQVPLYKYENR